MQVFPIPLDVPGRLAIMPRPGAGDFAALRAAGAQRLVSLLEQGEAESLGLGEERRLCEAAGIAFDHFPIRDFGVPDAALLASFADRIFSALEGGASVVIHCRGGIGRSGLVASVLLIRAGYPPAQAINEVSTARGLPVPETPEQRAFLEGYRPAVP